MRTSPTDTSVRIRVATWNEVSLVLSMAMWRRSARSPAFIRPHFSLYCSRLNNGPVGAEFLQSLEGVPAEQAQALVEDRYRNNGLVPFPACEKWDTPRDNFTEAGPLSEWSKERLRDHLDRILSEARAVASEGKWPDTAESLLAWTLRNFAPWPWFVERVRTWSIEARSS